MMAMFFIVVVVRSDVEVIDLLSILVDVEGCFLENRSPALLPLLAGLHAATEAALVLGGLLLDGALHLGGTGDLLLGGARKHKLGELGRRRLWGELGRVVHALLFDLLLDLDVGEDITKVRQIVLLGDRDACIHCVCVL